MSRIYEYLKYTKNFFLLIRLVLTRIIIKFRPIFGIGVYKLANKILSNKVLFVTPFGNYLCSSLNEYSLMSKDYEPEIGKLINRILEINTKNSQEKYLINIGCNIGRWAIDIAKNHKYNVIAFEPVPETFDKLRINIALSKLVDQFELYNMALGNKDDVVNFEYKPFHNGSSQIVKDKPLEGGDIIKVPLKKFDDLGICKEKLKKTKLIIMDVEGFEYEVLLGMKNSLKMFDDTQLIIEIWNENKNKDKIFEYMKLLGYSNKSIDDENYLFFKE